MFVLATGVLVLFSLLSCLVSGVLAATAPGRSLKVLAVSEAVLLAAWGICCLLELRAFGGGHIAWGAVLGQFA